MSVRFLSQSPTSISSTSPPTTLKDMPFQGSMVFYPNEDSSFSLENHESKPDQEKSRSISFSPYQPPSRNHTPLSASISPLPSSQKETWLQRFIPVLRPSDSSFSLENRVSNNEQEMDGIVSFFPNIRPEVVRPIAVLPENQTLALASPQELITVFPDSEPSSKNRASKRPREESRIPSSSPTKKARLAQLLDSPMNTIPVSPQLPTADTLPGHLNSDGSRYFGDFKEGLFHGLGTLVSANGDIMYRGDFQQGTFHGHGTLTYANGTSYNGEFRNGVFHGKGFVQSSHFNASGEFQNNVMHGYGTLIMRDVYIYTGQFRNGWFHGQGQLSFLNGMTYQGEFHNNLYHGLGQLTFPNGMPPQIGVFRLGIFQQGYTGSN